MKDENKITMKNQSRFEASQSSEEPKYGFRKKALAVVAASAMAFGLSACGDNESTSATPQSTGVSTEAPQSDVDINDTDASEATQSEYTVENQTKLDVPVVYNGPFGDEYIPLYANEAEAREHALVPTTPLEEMRAMDAEQFAKLPIEDRAFYLYKYLEETDSLQTNIFTASENFIPESAPYVWNFIDGSSWNASSPEEAAKIIESYDYNNIENGQLSIESRDTIATWRESAKNAVEGGAYPINFEYVSSGDVRKEVSTVQGKYLATEVTFDVNNYDWNTGESTPIEQRTVEVVEVVVENPETGEPFIVYAQGYKR